MAEELHLEILPEEQQRLLTLLSEETFIKDFLPGRRYRPRLVPGAPAII